MTETKKKSFSDWFQNNIVSLVTLGAIIVGAVYWGEMQSLIFSNAEIKVRTEDYMQQKPSPKDEAKALIMDSINTTHAMKSRSKRDSVMGAILDKIKHQDSINLLNADQMFQIKEQLKK